MGLGKLFKKKINNISSNNNNNEVGITAAPDEKEDSDRDDVSVVSYQSSMDGSIARSAYGDEAADPDMELRRLDYYHGFLPRSDAEALLTQQGDFLLRKTEGSGKPTVLISIRFSDASSVPEFGHLTIPKNSENSFWIVSGDSEVPQIDVYLTEMLTAKKPITDDARTMIKARIPRQAYMLRHNQIIQEKKIGEGAFGEVFKGKLFLTTERPLVVAIKCLKTDAVVTKDQREEFIAESRICRRLHHPNIIKFRGIAIDETPLMMVLEWAEGGSLIDLLHKRGSEFDPAARTLFCVQAAQGMRYLEKNKIIHRDVAARNCLLGDNRVKIADFGLSLISTKLKKMDLENTILPIRWLAPETMTSQVFSHKTDVYSFGVMMWEIFSNGKTPFGDLNLKQVVSGVTQNGLTLGPPRQTPEGVDKLMRECSNTDPAKRPTFLTLKLRLRKEYDNQIGRGGLLNKFKKKIY